MIKSITINPNTQLHDILFFDSADLTPFANHVIPLFGTNGIGKSTLIQHIERSKDVTFGKDEKLHHVYSYLNARDNRKFSKPKTYEESFDPVYWADNWNAKSVSEGQSIIYSMFDLLDMLVDDETIPVEENVDLLILLDEVDSGMAIDNIDIMMEKIKAIVEKRSDVQIIFSFNSPRILKHFPQVLSMCDGKAVTLYTDEDMAKEIKKHKKEFDKARKTKGGRPKIFD